MLHGDPTGAWAVQHPRDVLMNLGQRAERIRFFICDRDAKYTRVFDRVFTSLGVRSSNLRYELLGRTRSPSGGSGLRDTNAPTGYSSTVSVTYVVSLPNTNGTTTTPAWSLV